MTKRFGVRGVVLMLFGFPWFMYGIGILNSDQDRFSQLGPNGPMQFMDEPAWGWLWVASGVFAVVAMFLRNKYTHLDELAYGFLVIPPALWTISYLISFILFEYTHGVFGQGKTYLGFTIFADFLIILLYLSRHLKDVALEVDE